MFDPGGVLTSISVRYQLEQITFLSPTIAVIRARQRSANPDGQPADGAGADPMEAILTVTAERSDGHWRIRMGQNTPVAP